jgi:hypothetical protein
MVLQRNEEQWTSQYLAARGTDREKASERWRDPEIKRALREETAQKCAYCEALIEDVSYPHVEHIVPKALYPELAHRWTNLTLACPQCNGSKGSFYDPIAGILDPYVDLIDNFIFFYGTIVRWKLGAVRGEVTVRSLKLNRLDLVRSRKERIEKVAEMVDRWGAANEPLRTILYQSITEEIETGEFTRSVKDYVERLGFPIACDD